MPVKKTSPQNTSKIGVIAGSGSLPRHVVEAALSQGRGVVVVVLQEEEQQEYLNEVTHKRLSLGEVRKTLDFFRKEGVSDILLVGTIKRPSFTQLRLDFGGLGLAKRILQNKRKGDDAIFRLIIHYIEEKGFTIQGVQDTVPELLASEGVLGRVEPKRSVQDDIALGAKIAHVIGREDIGQAVIVRDGLVLGVEAAEGTDQLIARCAELRKEGAGGVLVKMKKPSQDSRIDLPTIGLNTIENIHKAHFDAIAVEAGATIILEREKLIKRANTLGIAIIGI